MVRSRGASAGTVGCGAVSPRPSALSPQLLALGQEPLPSFIRHERSREHRDRGLAVSVYRDRDDVEAAGAGVWAPPSEVVGGHQDDLPALAGRDGFDGDAVSSGSARFHLDEDQRRAVARDDVDFASPGAVAAINNCVPPAQQFVAGEIFPDFPSAQCCDVAMRGCLSKPRAAARSPGRSLDRC